MGYYGLCLEILVRFADRMSDGLKTYRWKNLVVKAGTEKGAIKKLRKLVASGAVEAEFVVTEPVPERELTRDELQWLSETMMARHHWYVELVVRSKIGEIHGDYEPSAEWFQANVKRVQTPNGKEHVEVGGSRVILLNGQKQAGVTVIEYPRVPEFGNGRMAFQYEINDAL